MRYLFLLTVSAISMAIARDKVNEADKWNVEAMYPSTSAWEKEFLEFEARGFDDLVAFRGTLDDEQSLKKYLKLSFEYGKKLEYLYTYSHLRHDEDVALEENKGAYQRSVQLYHNFSNATSWAEPEILQMEESELFALMESKALKEYSWHLKRLWDQKAHVLGSAQEELLSLAAMSTGASSRTFGAFNNADLKFKPAHRKDGTEVELTHGTYGLNLKEKDRTLRESTFKNVHGAFGEWENTVTELLSGQVQSHIFNAKARKFDSCLHAALFPHQVDVCVYRNLVDTVRARLPSLHKYVAMRKARMRVKTVHAYDMYVPMVKDFEKKYSYDEATKIVLDSITPLGKEYGKILTQGLLKERWVDVYESDRKRSGAYSSGCFDSHPYILLNYQGTLNDVLTLAHEAGHSMHSYYSNHKQPYQYSDYPIFVAEVASTFNEELTYRHLLETVKDPKEREFIINQKIDSIRATLFRQTMFAEFELTIHEMAEKGEPLTPARLKEAYIKLNEEYFGPDFTCDPELALEFLRIPHFYYNFYVYQYATGISAAYALVEKVMKEGNEEYLGFLSSGSSQYPVELLRIAGVDITLGEPINKLCDHFDSLVNELDQK